VTAGRSFSLNAPLVHRQSCDRRLLRPRLSAASVERALASQARPGVARMSGRACTLASLLAGAGARCHGGQAALRAAPATAPPRPARRSRAHAAPAAATARVRFSALRASGIAANVNPLGREACGGSSSARFRDLASDIRRPALRDRTRRRRHRGRAEIQALRQVPGRWWFFPSSRQRHRYRTMVGIMFDVFPVKRLGKA